MALKASTDAKAVKEPNFVKSYFKNGIIGNMKTLIAVIILNLLSFPVVLISLTYDLYIEHLYTIGERVSDNYYGGNSGWFLGLAFLFTALAAASGIIFALNNFSYLYKKQNVDMYLSLPLKNSQRFLCDYFSGLVCYVGPFLLSGLITLSISPISMTIVPEMHRPIEGSMYLPGLIIRFYLILAAIMIMYYTLAVLVCSVCGNSFETRFYTGLINGLIPAMIAIIILVLFGGAFGVIYEEYITPLISRTSPVGALIGFGLYAAQRGDTYVASAGFAAGYIFSLLAVSALYAAGAYLLYRKRKAEDVSKPFVYNSIFHIIITCIMFALAAMASPGSSSNFPLIVFMAVVYMIFSAVNKRGFKKFRNTVISCVITIAACMGFSIICQSTNGFGISYRVPEAGSVKSVTIGYFGPENVASYYGGDNFDEHNSITVSDPETIENIIKAHKSIIEKYDGLDYYDYGERYFDVKTQPVRIKYKLKNGTTLTRQYDMTEDELNYLNYVCLDSSYEDQAKELLRYSIMRSDRITLKTNFEFASWSVENYDDEEKKYYKEIAKKISEAYAKDLASRTIEQLNDPYEEPVATIGINSGYRTYNVYSWDKNTLNAIAEIKELAYSSTSD